MPEVSAQPNTPQVVAKAAGFNWKSVLIATVIGAVVIGAAAAGLCYYLNQSQLSLETGSVTIKSATPSAKSATASAKPDGTVGWKTFTSKTDGYEVKYPSSWLFNDTKCTESNTEQVAFAPTKDRLGQCGVRGGVVTFQYIQDSYETQLNYAEQGMDANFQKTNTTVGGQSAAKVSGFANGGADRVIEYLINRGSYVLRITYFQNIQEEPNNTKTFDLMLSTFKFL